MRIRIGLLLVLGSLVCGCSREKSTDELIRDLDSSQEKDRIVAVRLLGAREGDAARIVPALVKALKSKESDVRWSAAIDLGYFGEQATEAIPVLKEAEHDHDARIREAASVALHRIDPAKFPNPAKRRVPRGK
jgi:HEAT repeat protein